MMFAGSKKKEPLHIVSTLPELEALVHAKTRQRVVLGGDLVLASIVGHVPSSDYIKQPSRTISRTSLLKSGSKTKLQVWLSRGAFELLARAGSRIQASLAIDHYVRWGLRQKTPEFILFGGDATVEKSIVLVMHFKKGALIRLGEKCLPGLNNPRFFGEIAPLLETSQSELQGAPMYWAAPLPEMRDPSLIHIGAEILAGRPGFVITTSGKSSFLARHGSSLAIVGVSVGIYAAAAGYPYFRYQHAASQFEAESTELRGDFQFAADRLKLLKERKELLRSPAESVRKVTALEKLLTVAAENHYPLQDATLRLKKDEKADKRAYDLEVTIEQPRDDKITAIEQASPLVSRLSTEMGTPMHLAQTQSFQETEVLKGQFKRVYRVEGDIRAKAD